MVYLVFVSYLWFAAWVFYLRFEMVVVFLSAGLLLILVSLVWAVLRSCLWFCLVLLLFVYFNVVFDFAALGVGRDGFVLL